MKPAKFEQEELQISSWITPPPTTASSGEYNEIKAKLNLVFTGKYENNYIRVLMNTHSAHQGL